MDPKRKGTSGLRLKWSQSHQQTRDDLRSVLSKNYIFLTTSLRLRSKIVTLC